MAPPAALWEAMARSPFAAAPSTYQDGDQVSTPDCSTVSIDPPLQVREPLGFLHVDDARGDQPKQVVYDFIPS
jgi:hypothetical protein